MKTDIEILLESWKKYKNKNSNKAQNLRRKIQSEIAIIKLYRKHKII